jgi:hypothetical protein
VKQITAITIDPSVEVEVTIAEGSKATPAAAAEKTVKA